EGPARGVHHRARLDSARGNLPQFLYPECVRLRITVSVESLTRDQLLGQRAARSFGKNRQLGANVVARLIVTLSLAVAIDPFIIRAHATNAIVIEEQFPSRKTGKDAYTAVLDQLAQPAAKPVQRNNIVAVVAEKRGFHR